MTPKNHFTTSSSLSSSMAMMVTTSLLFLTLTTWLQQPCQAQELPNPLYQTNAFNTTVTFRQSVCDRQQQLHLGGIERLEDALQGFELRTAVLNSQFFISDDETGGISEGYPGLTSVLLDEVARRGKFTWRNSFVVIEPPPPDKTWTDLLVWATERYDIVVDWWLHSLDRVSLGVAFLEPWYDGSFILVGKQAQEEEEVFTPWSWLAPFDYDVWATILGTIIGSGLIYMFLEKVDPYSDKRSLQRDPAETIFMSAMGFAGHIEFECRTHPARLFTFSLSMWALLIGAAYTANLASFLVVKNANKNSIDSVEEAVRQQVPICVFAGAGHHLQLVKDFPNAVVVEKQLEEDTFRGIVDGECTVTVTSVASWEFWQRSEEANPECQLEWLGRKYRSAPAGFATKSDSGIKCTSLVRDVVNVHLLQMKEEGFIRDAWEQHLDRTATIDCSVYSVGSSAGRRQLERGGDSVTSGGGDRVISASGFIRRQLKGSAVTSSGGGGDVSLDSNQLSIKNTGGIFILHAGLSAIAMIAALIHRWFGLQAKRDEERREANLRKHLERSTAKKSLRNLKDPEDKREKLLLLMSEFSDDGDALFDDIGFDKSARTTTNVTNEAMSSSSFVDHINTRFDEQMEATERLEKQITTLTRMVHMMQPRN